MVRETITTLKTDRILGVLLSIIGVLLFQVDANAFVEDSIPIPTVDEVGAKRLPDTIAPIETPFKMPEFDKPGFPPLTINIIDKGARSGKPATNAVQKAIDEVNKKGGGTVIVPSGSWRLGRIVLKSNVNLHIEEGAELRFSNEVGDYLPVVFTRSAGVEGMSLGGCIYANGQENIAITGKGKLVGPGPDGKLRSLSVAYGHIEEVVPIDKPATERIFDGQEGRKIYLPPIISTINCKNVYIEGVSLENSSFWNLVPIYCDGVIIRGVTINSVGIPSGDGIDISSSKNVLIEYCTISSGDDCFTLKSGRGVDGLRVNKPTKNVVIRYCLAKEGMGGVTTGSETAGMIMNVYAHDCVFDGTMRGVRLKTRRPRGGGGMNLYYTRLRMNLIKEAIAVDMLGSSMYVGKLASRLPGRKTDNLTPAYSNVFIHNIIVEGAREFVRIMGIPESPLNNMRIEKATVKSRKLLVIHDATNLTLKDIDVNSGTNKVDLLNARNVLFNNVHFTTPEDKLETEIGGALTGNIRFIDCKISEVPEK